jgi:hypothetical protein
MNWYMICMRFLKTRYKLHMRSGTFRKFQSLDNNYQNIHINYLKLWFWISNRHMKYNLKMSQLNKLNIYNLFIFHISHKTFFIIIVIRWITWRTYLRASFIISIHTRTRSSARTRIVNSETGTLRGTGNTLWCVCSQTI